MKTIELFCGAGLMGQGFSNENFEMIFAADTDISAIQSYNRNLKHKVAELSDVTKIKNGIKCDLIIAGPPCQGYSTLGKRDAKDVRNKLCLVLPDWADATSAKVVVVENVPQFITSLSYKNLVRRFSKMDFDHTSWILNARDFGVAQDRKRSFTIFSKIGIPDQPRKKIKRYTIREAFKGLGRPTGKLDPLHLAFKLSNPTMKRVKIIPPNGGKKELMKLAPHLCPASWFLLGQQAVDVWGRMNFNSYSNTIRCCFWNPSKGRYLHPFENRVITLREGARLQGIPDHWQFEGNKSTIARQIGNGVPIPLAREVAKSIRKLF